MNDIRIIPFAGPPLEYEGAESSRTLFSAPERGFLIGPENYALEPVLHGIIEGNLTEESQPVLFYGPVGSGRSHLLRGVFDAWRKNQSSDAMRRRSYLITATDFARLYSDAMATRTTDDFRRRYRKALLLLIDDIDRIFETDWAQEEFQHTLDAVTAHGGTTVLVSDELPGRELTPSLAGRLLGGTPLPVFLPGPAVRKRFLRETASAFRLTLPETALDAAAEKLEMSIPMLYGTFARMVFEANVAGTRIDTVYLKRFLKNRDREKRPGVDAVARKTARHFAIRLSDLKGGSRNQSISLARSVAIYLASRQAGATTMEIARYFGNRDPSTIRYSIQKIRNEMQSDVTLRDHLFRLGLR